MNSFSERALIERIEASYQKITGQPLPSPQQYSDRIWWLHHEAPYSILAHAGGPDPVFIYANQCALQCFQYSREQILQLPSRLSAATLDQQARQVILDSLAIKGIVQGYTGMRVNSKGEFFPIYDCEIWQLKDDADVLWGQAALFWPTAAEGPARFDR